MDAKRPGQCRPRPHLSRQHRYPQRREPRQPLRHRSLVRSTCRNRSTSSSICESRVLYWTDRGDPPRGNTVNRAPIDAPAKTTTPEILISASDGGHRHRARRSRQPDVRHRLRRLGLFRRSRWHRTSATSFRPRQSLRHCLRRNLLQQRRIDHVATSPFAASPSSERASSARAGRRCFWPRAWMLWRRISRRMPRPR